MGLLHFGFGAVTPMRRYRERGRAEVGGRVRDAMRCYPDEAGFPLSLQRDSNALNNHEAIDNSRRDPRSAL